MTCFWGPFSSVKPPFLFAQELQTICKTFAVDGPAQFEAERCTLPLGLFVRIFHTPDPQPLSFCFGIPFILGFGDVWGMLQGYVGVPLDC